MQRVRCLAAVCLVSALLGVIGVACGQKKIEGPTADTGEVSLRVMYLVDPSLPALTEEELRAVLAHAERRLQLALGRRVTFAGVTRGNLREMFDGWMKPFGKLTFHPRLDPTRALSDGDQRLLYERLLELLRTDRLRPLLPLFSLDPQTLDVAVVLDRVVQQFDRTLEKLRENEVFKRDGLAAHRSIFSWYTLIGSFAEDAKPADVILTNDLLMFDAMSSMPSQSFILCVAIGYTRPYPGVSLISTLPFLSEEPFFVDLRGPATPEQKRDLIALALAQEVGGKLILMRQDEYTHPACLSTVMTPPFVRRLAEPAPSAACPEPHHPMDRRRLRTEYLASYIRSAELRGDTNAAASAKSLLKELAPDHPMFFEIPATPKKS